LSFANDQDSHLAMLKEEGRDIFRALQDRHDQQHVEVIREESADIDDLFYNLNRYGPRVHLFHYGGHASGTHLRLEDQAAGAQGLARLLGSLPELKLVFLNGCSTRGQVQKLLNFGVKAVVATSVPINDSKAREFAT
jgi:DNA-binding NarL/FixJ family response regulator